MMHFVLIYLILFSILKILMLAMPITAVVCSVVRFSISNVSTIYACVYGLLCSIAEMIALYSNASIITSYLPYWNHTFDWNFILRSSYGLFCILSIVARPVLGFGRNSCEITVLTLLIASSSYDFHRKYLLEDTHRCSFRLLLSKVCLVSWAEIGFTCSAFWK